jgi:hypothetical protein
MSIFDMFSHSRKLTLVRTTSSQDVTKMLRANRAISSDLFLSKVDEQAWEKY